MTIELITILLLLGFVNGFYSGLLGTGGNVILIPVLDFILVSFAIEDTELVKFIIAHSLFITVFNSFSVSYKQYRINNFYLKDVLIMSFPAVIVGYIMSEIIKRSQWYDKTYFDLFFLILVLLVSIRFLFYKEVSIITNTQKILQENRFSYIVLGTITGIVTALSGFGGGIVLVPSFTDIFGMPIKKASSISIGVIMLLAISVSVSYLNIGSSFEVPKVLPYQYGYISLSLVTPILIGVFFGAPFGVKVAQKASSLILRYIFEGVMVLLCVKIIISFI